MKRRIVSGLVFLVTFGGLALLSPAPFACGPFFEQPVFTTLVHPDMPMESYVGGNLGIVQPSYARVYLYVAYRHLAGTPFDAREGKAMLAYWEPDPVVPAPPPGKSKRGWDKTWADYWLEVRDAFAELREKHSEQNYWPGYLSYREAQNYQSYLNCPEDAFRNAVQTFNERKRAFGGASAELREWAVGQNTVFQNCSPSREAPGPFLPGPSKPEWPTLLRADRAYQIAAAHFYSENFDTARALFEAIALDKNSPWQKLGAYLAARCWIRKATFGNTDTATWAAFIEAEKRLNAILASTELKEMHPAGRRLQGFVRFRLHPVERGKELASLLVDPQMTAGRRQDVIDFLRWLDVHYAGEEPYESAQILTRGETPRALAKLRAMSEVTDWIVSMQGGESELPHAIERWKATQSAAWLVAALGKMRANHAQVGELLTASEKIPAESPAYLTSAYHRLRLLLATGEFERARRELDMLLAPGRKLPVSARNAFRAMRMRLARNLAELLRDAVREQASAGDLGTDEFHSAPLKGTKGGNARMLFLDTDGSRLLTEKLPLAMLREAASSRTLPSNVRGEIVRAAWTRAVLLDDLETATVFSGPAAQTAPEMKKALDEFLSAQSREEKRFVAALLLLQLPGMRPFVTARMPRNQRLDELDSLRDNWWCSFSPVSSTLSPYNYYRMWLSMRGPLGDLYSGDKVPAPDFLSPAQKQASEREWQKLEGLPGAPNFLGEIVIGWARRHADDPRVPEALHRVVRATRLGCTDADSGRVSRTAFQLLHRRYPQSEWTRKTPYWFE